MTDAQRSLRQPRRKANNQLGVRQAQAAPAGCLCLPNAIGLWPMAGDSPDAVSPED